MHPIRIVYKFNFATTISCWSLVYKKERKRWAFWLNKKLDPFATHTEGSISWAQRKRNRPLVKLLGCYKKGSCHMVKRETWWVFLCESVQLACIIKLHYSIWHHLPLFHFILYLHICFHLSSISRQQIIPLINMIFMLKANLVKGISSTLSFLLHILLPSYLII